MYLLAADGEQSAQIISAAEDREQASLVFDIALFSVRQNAALKKRIKQYPATRRLLFPQTNSYYVAIPSDAAGAYGTNPHAVLFDELWTQGSRGFFDSLKTGMGARLQPLMVMVTTAGWDRQSICFEKWDYGRKVRDGKIDGPAFLPVIYEASDSDDWTSPETWRKANPNFGVSVPEEFFAGECKQAETSPTYENEFKRLYLNLWTNQQTRAISLDAWSACTESFRGQPGERVV